MPRLPGALVGLVALAAAAACGPTERAPEAHILVPTPSTSLPGDVTSGRSVYLSSCAACHGDAGEGAEGFGPDLRSSVVATRPDALLQQVTEGQGRMPSFAAVLDDAELRDVVAYVAVSLGGTDLPAAWRVPRPVDPSAVNPNR